MSTASFRNIAAIGADRRAFLAGSVALVATMARGAKAPVLNTERIGWAGANGLRLHGYMAIPGKARGRQPAVLILGEAGELPPVPDPVARRLVEDVATAGFIACTADHVTGFADLRASLAWLRFNRLTTGKVALLAIGTAAVTARRLADVDEGNAGALLLLGSDSGLPPVIPTLALDWRSDDTALPAGAAAFLKEHLA